MLYISVYIQRERERERRIIITHLRSHFGLSGGSSSITGGVLHRGSSTQGALRALGIIMLDLSNEELLQAPRVLSVPNSESLRKRRDFEGQSAQGRRQHLPLPSTMSGTTPPPRKVAKTTQSSCAKAHARACGAPVVDAGLAPSAGGRAGALSPRLRQAVEELSAETARVHGRDYAKLEEYMQVSNNTRDENQRSHA